MGTPFDVCGGTKFKMDSRFKFGPTKDIKMVCTRSIDGVNVDIVFPVFV